MGEARVDKLQLDGPNSPVVHVGGSNAVGARFAVRQGDVADAIDRRGVDQAPVVLVEDTAVAVRRVFAETDIGDDEEGGQFLPDELYGLDDRTVRVVRAGACWVFCLFSKQHAEENDAPEAPLY